MGTVCEVVWICVLVDISKVANSCFKSNISGRRNAFFILFICILLILLLMLSIHRFSSIDICTFAAAAVAVYSSADPSSISLRTSFAVGAVSYSRVRSIDSGSVFVVWLELPVNTSSKGNWTWRSIFDVISVLWSILWVVFSYLYYFTIYVSVSDIMHCSLIP